MEQTGFKLEKEYVKAVYCHPAYLTYMQTTSYEMPGWMKHKLESRLQEKCQIGKQAKWSRAKANRVLPRECTGHGKHHGHHQMINTEIRLIVLFAAKDGGAPYSQQKQDRELTVAQIKNFLLQNSDFSWRR